jgi:hypothetical protein
MNTFEEMTDMLQAYFECEKGAQAAICLYHQRFPNRAVPYHKKFEQLETNLGTYGAVKKPKKQYPVPRHENVELDVMLSIDENPDTSIRQIASEQGTSYGTVQRILKKHKVKPYIPQKVHAIDTRRSSQKS